MHSNGSSGRSPDHNRDERSTVAMILDKSGSMRPCRARPSIEGYNDYLADLRKDAADTYFSLTMFDTRFQRICTAEPLARGADARLRSATSRTG